MDDEIFVHYIDLGSVKATTTHNSDGSYSVFINTRISREQQLTAYIHELTHILSDDFNHRHDVSIDRLEYYAHRLIG